jgi:hypothetical protein
MIVEDATSGLKNRLDTEEISSRLFDDCLSSGALFAQDFDIECPFHLKLNIPKVFLVSEKDGNRHAGFNVA